MVVDSMYPVEEQDSRYYCALHLVRDKRLASSCDLASPDVSVVVRPGLLYMVNDKECLVGIFLRC